MSETPGDSGQPSSRGSGMHRLVQWMWRHKVVSVLIALLVVVILELSTIPFGAIARLGTDTVTETSLMHQRLDEARQGGKSLLIRQSWVPLSRLPQQLIDAVIVAEDGTFYSHGGVDWFEIRESLAKDVRERRVARGGSTITQQLAKNLFLSTSKDPIRKAKELLITYLLERTLSKDRILELYLNVIEWGPGVFGVESAARTYFGKHAADLSLDDAIRLAAVIPSPLKHHPAEDSRYVLRRKQIVLDRMAARRMIDLPITGETLSSSDSTGAPGAEDSSEIQDTPDTTTTGEGGRDGL